MILELATVGLIELLAFFNSPLLIKLQSGHPLSLLYFLFFYLQLTFIS